MNPITIEAENLQRLFRENAMLRIFIEDLTDPERHGHSIKQFCPEVFKQALELRKGWEKK